MIKIALIGAGGRGQYSYAPYVLNNPGEAEFVAVVEPMDRRRNEFQKRYNIPDENCFTDWNDFFKRPKMADAVIIATQDQLHYEPTVKAHEKGYHILLEKPMATTPSECKVLGELASDKKQLLSICHVLRYTDFFTKIKNLIDEGRIGKLISIQHNENVGFFHYAHSYIRGNWRNSDESAPMILAKSCHDMDILLWLSGAHCKRVSSFGELSHFRPENAPEGSAIRCSDGCAVEEECPYSALKIYLGETIKDVSGRDYFKGVVNGDIRDEAILRSLQEGPYGRCVYRSDNNVVDHQVVILEFENGVTATFNMCGFTDSLSRTIKLMGTKGQIKASMEKNEILLYDFVKDETIVFDMNDTEKNGSAHGGGDLGYSRIL
jgi:predicted dehydrogenase